MSPFTKFNNSDESYGFVFWQTYVLWSRKVKAALKPFQLTHTQFVILSVIAYLQQERQETTQADVAKLSKIDKMTTSTSLKTLIKNGYVTLASSTNDSRAHALKLSAKGQDIQQQALHLIEAIDEEFFNQPAINTEAFLEMMRTLREGNG